MAHHQERRLQELGDGCHAYVQPGGGWGWSNAGLIVGEGRSLLVDTLFDLRLTEAMLDEMAPLTEGAPVSSLVNTHANGDHCYGNSEVTRRWSSAEIVSSTATAHEMADVPPSMLAALNHAPGEVGELFRSFFGEFEFDGIELVLPDPHVRRPADARRRRPPRRADRGRPGPHRRRHDRARARCVDRVHRRHPVHRRDADRVGRPAVELDRRVRPDARPRRRHGRAGSRSRHRQVGRHRGAGLPGPRRRARRRRASTQDSTRSTRPARSARRSVPTSDSANWASSVASPSTSRPCTAPSIRPTTTPDVVEQFRRMAQLEHS